METSSESKFSHSSIESETFPGLWKWMKQSRSTPSENALQVPAFDLHTNYMPDLSQQLLPDEYELRVSFISFEKVALHLVPIHERVCALLQSFDSALGFFYLPCGHFVFPGHRDIVQSLDEFQKRTELFLLDIKHQLFHIHSILIVQIPALHLYQNEELS
jgi:hypothetical protein